MVKPNLSRKKRDKRKEKTRKQKYKYSGGSQGTKPPTNKLEVNVEVVKEGAEEELQQLQAVEKAKKEEQAEIEEERVLTEKSATEQLEASIELKESNPTSGTTPHTLSGAEEPASGAEEAKVASGAEEELEKSGNGTEIRNGTTPNSKQIQEKPGEKKSQNPVNFFAPVLLIVLIGFVSVN